MIADVIAAVIADVIAAVIWIRVRRLVGEEVHMLPVAGGGGGGRSGGGEGGRRGGARAECVDGDGAEACAEGVLHLRERAECQHVCDVGMPRMGTGEYHCIDVVVRVPILMVQIVPIQMVQIVLS